MRVSEATKQATRQRILAAAQKRFAEQGFEATTTREIAREARIAAGTLFNYFPTKEAIVAHLVEQAQQAAADAFHAERLPDVTADAKISRELVDEALSLEEDLFSHVAAILRKLKPFRNYLPAVLETSLSPLVADPSSSAPTMRDVHLASVAELVSRHGQAAALTSVALQLYWTLYLGVLSYWSQDSSPRQENTLALLDESMSMFVTWLIQLQKSET